jgi:hypothetical protein
MFIGRFSRLLLQVAIDDSFGETTSSDPVKSRTGFGALPGEDRPFPSCRIGRLNDDVLDTPVFHDRTSLVASLNQRRRTDFGKFFLMCPMGYGGFRQIWWLITKNHQIGQERN